MHRYLFLLISFTLFYFSAKAQYTISGTVIDATTSKPIANANVYIDGTVFGSITNAKGRFTLDLEKPVNFPLVISSVSYKTKVLPIDFSSQSISFDKIPIQEELNTLTEVYIESDPWSRKRKMKYFKKWFLGKNHRNKKTEILNESAIQLKFIPSSNKLIAYAEKPLRVRNEKLGYLINYDLMEFELLFSKVDFVVNNKEKTNYNEESSFFLGTSFFKELQPNKVEKYSKARKENYKGSTLHFMRALYDKKLKEKNYRTFIKKTEVNPYQIFKTKQTDSLTYVSLTNKKTTILYDDFYQSFIQVEQVPTNFSIDKNGNYQPINALYLGGGMGQEKLADFLPLNYQPK